MDIAKLKEKVISEVNTKPNMTDNSIFNFVLKLVNNNIEHAIEFMVAANGGGYTKGQVKYLLDKKNRQTHLRLI